VAVPLLYRAEAVAAAAAAFPAIAVLTAYLLDVAGLRIAPAAVFAAAVAGSALLFARLARGSRPDRPALAAFGGIVAAVGAWLISIARPDFLPMGGGADLIHHLQLIDYIERHWRLVHDPALESYLGEMAHYTPGSHLLAALAGAWTGGDGFRAFHSVAAVTVAIKAGIVFLIARRLLPDGPALLPLAASSVLFLLLPLFYFVGSFTRYSYLAQVVAELFAVCMWWMAIVWHQERSTRAAALFGLFGAATFLTWPIWIGPPLVMLAWTVAAGRATMRERALTLLMAVTPIAAVAAIHAAGRIGWTAIARTGAEVRIPAPADFGWVFLPAAAAGLVIAAMRARARPAVLFAAAIGAQTVALYVLARADGAETPYMAIKMVHLALYPAAVAGALAVSEAWRLAISRSRRGERRERTWGWLLLVAGFAAVVPHVARMARQPPTVAVPLYEAGRWARANLPAECAAYLVADEQTAYWLHLAVLGSRRLSDRTADARTYDMRDAIVRWIERTGMPYAIADLSTLPKDVRETADVLMQFDSAVVIKRRGPVDCP
jgi:hypothetical protein